MLLGLDTKVALDTKVFLELFFLVWISTTSTTKSDLSDVLFRMEKA